MVFKLFILILVSAAIGIVIGRYSLPIRQHAHEADIDSNLQEIRAGGYRFISPLLECETGSDYYKINGLHPLQQELMKFVDQQKSNNSVTDAAIYFRDLQNGPWIGINEHDPFSPASLLKLPVMMAFFKKAEVDPQLLSKKIKYDKDLFLLDQAIKSSETIKKGEEYTLQELIERMLIHSDNAALSLLEANIEPAAIDKITIDLGVETANAQTPEDFMSVKGYAGLFRILYNASYLEKDLSEKALEILSKTEFKQGIVSGVPKTVTVAHKFGERELENGIIQLHDCGIVYHPQSPYLICIMTRGNNINSLEDLIQNASALIYQSVDKPTTSSN